MNRFVVFAVASLLCVSSAANVASSEEIKVLSPGATLSSLAPLLPQFEQTSGHKVTISYGPVGSLVDRLKNNEAVDVILVSEPAADELRALGKLVPNSQSLIATVGVGVFVRKGDPKPDISSVEAFMRAVANAKYVAYSDPKQGGGSAATYVAGMMAQLDITGSIKSKTKMTPPAKPLADLVASGAVDFGLNQITEVLADPRLELVGPLPPTLQNYTRYVANLVAASRQQEPGKALIGFLGTPEAKAVMRSKGVE